MSLRALQAAILKCEESERQLAQRFGVKPSWVNRVAVALRARGRLKGPLPREIWGDRVKAARAMEIERIRRAEAKRAAIRSVVLECKARRWTYGEIEAIVGVSKGSAQNIVRRWV